MATFNRFENILVWQDEVGKLTGALMNHLKSSDLKGPKYK